MDDVYEYFDDQRARLKRLSSGLLTDDQIDRMFSATRDGRRGLFKGVLPLAEGAYVDILERVVLDEHGGYERTRYSYYLIVDGHGDVRGYERDPTHDPAYHWHDSAHQRYSSDPVSLEEAVEVFWDLLTQLRHP